MQLLEIQIILQWCHIISPILIFLASIRKIMAITVNNSINLTYIMHKQGENLQTSSGLKEKASIPVYHFSQILVVMWLWHIFVFLPFQFSSLASIILPQHCLTMLKLSHSLIHFCNHITKIMWNFNELKLSLYISNDFWIRNLERAFIGGLSLISCTVCWNSWFWRIYLPRSPLWYFPIT